MIKYGKTERVGDHTFTHETHKEVPEGWIIQTKGNRHGQIEDMSPRQVDGVDLYSKYYHRDAKTFVPKYLADVLALNARRLARAMNK